MSIWDDIQANVEAQGASAITGLANDIKAKVTAETARGLSKVTLDKPVKSGTHGQSAKVPAPTGNSTGGEKGFGMNAGQLGTGLGLMGVVGVGLIVWYAMRR